MSNPAANAAMRTAAGAVRNANAEQDGEETQQPSMVSNTISAGKEVVKDQVKKGIKITIKNFVIAHWPVILMVIGVLFSLLVVIVIAAYAYENINQITDLAIATEEKTLNFITGNGANDNLTATLEKINEASSGSNGYPGLDKGILIATLNDSAFISPTLYDEEYEEAPAAINPLTAG